MKYLINSSKVLLTEKYLYWRNKENVLFKIPREYCDCYIFGKKLPRSGLWKRWQLVARVYSSMFRRLLIGLGSTKEMNRRISNELLTQEVFTDPATERTKKHSEQRKDVQYFLLCHKDFEEAQQFLNSADEVKEKDFFLSFGGNRDEVSKEYVAIAQEHNSRILAAEDKAQIPFEEVPKEFRFAVGPHQVSYRSTGSHRNSILLFAKGKRVWSFDDDTIPEFFSDRQAELKTLSVGSLKQHPLYRIKKGMQSYKKKQLQLLPTKDCFELWNSFLGCDHSSILNCEYFDRVNAAKVDHFFYAKDDGRTKKIRLVIGGIYGDSASNDFMSHLKLDAKTLKTELSSHESVKTYLESRELLSLSPTYSLDQIEPFQSYFFGLDLREIVLPFFPFFRQQDTIWAIMSRKIFPEDYQIEIPYAIRHQPLPSRSINTPEVAPYHCCDLKLIFSYILAGAGNFYQSEERGSRIKRLGSFLEIVLENWNKNFREEYFRKSSEEKLRSLEELEFYRARYKKSRQNAFVEAIDERIKFVTETLAKEPCFAPLELARCYKNKSVAESVFKSMMEQYAQLLQSWPDLWNLPSSSEKYGQKMQPADSFKML